MYTTGLFRILTAGLGALALAAPTTKMNTSQAVADHIGSMSLPADGFVHIANDGIARSYAGNGTVVDYRRLSSSDLSAWIDGVPPSLQEKAADFRNDFGSANGYDVKNVTQIWNPPASLRPQGWEPKPAITTLQSTDPLHRARQLGVDCVGEPCSNSEECLFKGCSWCTLSGGGYWAAGLICF